MATFKCNHGGGVMVPATWYLMAQHERKWHGKQAIEHDIADLSYACCDTHLLRAVSYLTEFTDDMVIRVRKVSPPAADAAQYVLCGACSLPVLKGSTVCPHCHASDEDE